MMTGGAAHAPGSRADPAESGYASAATRRAGSREAAGALTTRSASAEGPAAARAASDQERPEGSSERGGHQ